ncbi:hypothetical protein [Bacteroides timonensis]|uniref:hypothetical protein n=1 Tax=Bacteroides timonensis TaxID=1470345 RepID=UPI0004B5C9D0|nr:hypothetical protein [Bacteroides timonensis]
MKKFMNYYLLAMLAICCSFMASCSDDDEVIPPEPQPEELPTPTLRFGESIDSYNGSDIPVLTENADTIYYRYSLPQGTLDEIDPAAVWNKTAVDTETDSTVIHIDLDINMDKRVKYVMEAYASITKEKQSAKSETLSKSFQSLKANLIEISEVQVGPTAIVFNAEILNVPDKADGFFYQIYLKEEYQEADFKSTYEYAVPITSSGMQGQSYLEPNREYILAIAPSKIGKNDWGGDVITEILGNVITRDFVTRPYVLNSVDATVSIAPVSSNYSSITIDVTNGSNAAGFYYGAVKTSDMNGANIEDFLIKNDWFTMHASSNISTFLDQMGAKQEKVSARIARLAENTEYTVFAIACDTVYTPGKIVSATYKTSSLTFDSKASVEVSTAMAEYQTIVLNCTLLNGCTKAAYAYRRAGSINEAEALELVLANVEDPGYTTTGGEIRIDYLDPGEYDLFVLPVDGDNQFGKMQKFVISTKLIQFDGNATVTATITNTEAGDYGPVYTIAVTKGANCAKFYYGHTYDFADGRTDLEYASFFILNNTPLPESSEATFTFQVNNWGEAAKAVVIPVDANGVNGTPVVLSCPGNAVTMSTAAKHKKK